MLLSQQLKPQVFWKMMKQAWHTYLWAVSPIPLCSASQAPSGLMGSVGAKPFFRSLQRCSIWFKSDSSLKDMHRAVLKPLCLGFELGAECPAERWSAASFPLSWPDSHFLLPTKPVIMTSTSFLSCSFLIHFFCFISNIHFHIVMMGWCV